MRTCLSAATVAGSIDKERERGLVRMGDIMERGGADGSCVVPISDCTSP